jgi:hypothetical protein
VEELKQKALIVWLIMNGKAEEALERLASHYNVDVPKLKVGLPKRHKKQTLGCYEGKSKIISVVDSDALKNPFVILHEFYHHIRTTVDLKHKGTEKNANEFAKDFVHAFERIQQATSNDTRHNSSLAV